MPTFYLDEAGFTGQDLLAADQPIFVQSSTNLTVDETTEVLGKFFSGVKADELKHSRLSRNLAHQSRITSLVEYAAGRPESFAIWVAHKEYAAVTFVVEWWIEPLAHMTGVNLYKDGGNQAMANMLFLTLGAFWPPAFRGKLLLAFQRLFRARTQERFDEWREFVEKARADSIANADRAQIIQYFSPSFQVLDLGYVRRLPEHALDLALPGLIRLGHKWRERHAGPWEVVHDRSSNMAKQAWMWERLSATDFGEAIFDGPHGPNIFPMNVVTTRFADSKDEKQIQLCDLIAGATLSSLTLPPDSTYRMALEKAGIRDLAIDGIWPSDAVTPEALGRRGWDGSKAIDWMSERLRRT